MILNLSRFIAQGRDHWEELETLLQRVESNPDQELPFADLRRFHLLYQLTSADLARVSHAAADPDLRRYLESLVARAYAEVHETRDRRRAFSPRRWFFRDFPQTFRRHAQAFQLAVLLTLLGCAFGALALKIDPDAKSAIMPFSHLQDRPSERVKREESVNSDRLEGHKATFSATLMTHNTQVSITALALGMTWGIGTILLLFYNGVILGAVAFDYIADGQLLFLLGWLLPHGVIEIPAILVAGQAGLVLARALIGRGERTGRLQRLREAAPDLVTLIGGAALMLVWAGVVEAFLSQYHAPVLPYSAKIAFGAVEAVLLTLYLSRSGLESKAA